MTDLTSLTDSATLAVAESGLEGIRAEVVLVLDVSRSMYPIYRARIVQELVPQLLALSVRFDDDGVIPAYAFGDTCRHLRDLRQDDFAGWVEREVIRTGNDYQRRCLYAPVIHDVCRYFFPEEWDRPARKETVGLFMKKERVVYPELSAPRALPVLAIFVTGGDCEDEAETVDAVRRASRLPIFWQFVGLSPPGRLTPFRFLKRLDKLGNTHVDNCGFFEPGDTRNPRMLYRGLLNELATYLRRPEVLEMLRPAEDGGRTTRGIRQVPPTLDEEIAAIESRSAIRRRGAAPTPDPQPAPEPAPASARPPATGPHPSLNHLRAKAIDPIAAHPSAARSSHAAEPDAERVRPASRRTRPSEEVSFGASVPSSTDTTGMRRRVNDSLVRLRETLRTYGAEEDDEPAAPPASSASPRAPGGTPTGGSPSSGRPR